MGIIPEVFAAESVTGQFRAAPTTERETSKEVLGPKRHWAFNGTVSNEDELWDRFGEGRKVVDTEAVAALLEAFLSGNPHTDAIREVMAAVQEIEGSFSLARYVSNPQGAFLLSANFKPLYWASTGDACAFCSEPDPFKRPRALPPYTSRVLTEDGLRAGGPHYRKTGTDEALVSMSGGLDSTTVAYLLDGEGFDVTLIHARYGCNAEDREAEAVREIARQGNFNLQFVDLPRVMDGTLTRGEAHAGSEEKAIEGAETASDWVSARNLLMLSTLTALAESYDAGVIAYGGNLEEAGSYPDNEKAFADRFRDLLPFAVEPGRRIELRTPLANMMKHEIVELGARIGVPHELTWSCYGGGPSHCGECGPCYMRRVAFERNGILDPVQPSQ